MFITLRNQIFKIILLIACAVILIIHLSVPINLVDSDLGRHIINGELILKGTTDIFYKNFYSYTHPEFPFINHHWFFGIIAFILFHFVGFKGLSIFYIVLLLGAFLLAFDSARRYSNFVFAVFVSVASLMLLTSRQDVRPEGVSIFLMMFDFWLIQHFLQNDLSERALLITMTLAQLFWVNTHIFFFMGPVLIGVFLWQAKLSSESKQKIKVLKGLLLLSILTSLINPSGWWGMLTPLNGFKGFGYDLAENQGVFFMLHRFPQNFTFKYFLCLCPFFFIGMILAIYRDGLKAFPLVLLGAFMMVAAFKAVRLIMPFSFFVVPLSAYYYSPYINKKTWMTVIFGLLSVFGLIWCAPKMSGPPQIGLMQDVNASAEYFKVSGLKGPVFNNYDIGSYLIYHLYGQEKVFVDNRQEAYPVEFFRREYIPMQYKEAEWQKAQEIYGFNVIYFYRHDLTEWGQDFLVYRILDPQWAPVYADSYVVIYARRGSINQDIIDRDELPKKMFKIIRRVHR